MFFDRVHSKYIKCCFHIGSHGRGKQQPAEGGREVEVVLGSKENRSRCLYLCIYADLCHFLWSTYGHQRTDAPVDKSDDIKRLRLKVLERCGLSAVCLFATMLPANKHPTERLLEEL